MKSTANRGPRRRLWFALAAAIALWVRMAAPDDRPVHTDEAVNAVIVGDMLSGGTYRYDPGDRHGPAFYYLAASLCRAAGARRLADLEARHLREAPAFAGTAAVLAVGLLPGEAAGAALAAALLLAIGAPFVFYGRTAIHESLLVFAFLLALAASWRFWSTGRVAWAAIAGLGLGLAAATKESTAALAAASALAAAACGLHGPTRRLWRNRLSPALGRARLAAGLAIGAAMGITVVVLLYSSFGRNPGGLADFWRSFLLLSRRAASGAGHGKPWWTYLAWLARPSPLCEPWFGWLFLISASWGAYRAFSVGRDAPLARFCAILGVLLLAAFSAVPYKTPWLMLEFLAPLAPVAGYGLADGLRDIAARAGRPAAFVVACGLAFLAAHETGRLCFRYTDEPLNPFAYSPTSPDMARLTVRLDRIAAATPGGRDLLVQVAGADTWPLPWYLRKFPRVGYWTSLPGRLMGDVLIVSPDQAGAAEARLGPGWHREYFGLRADVLILLYSRLPPERA